MRGRLERLHTVELYLDNSVKNIGNNQQVLLILVHCFITMKISQVLNARSHLNDLDMASSSM